MLPEGDEAYELKKTKLHKKWMKLRGMLGQLRQASSSESAVLCWIACVVYRAGEKQPAATGDSRARGTDGEPEARQRRRSTAWNGVPWVRADPSHH